VTLTPVQDPALRGRIVEAAGPQNLTLTEFAERLIAGSGRPGRINRVPLAGLRPMSVLARPVAPVFARQARAAVVMSRTDMAVDRSRLGHPPPIMPATSLDDVLARPAAALPHP
jgi:uncharacterized protein YbjT (DUF2867 family)